MDYLPRPIVEERPDYEPMGLQEEFIVPLLRRHIEEALPAYAAPAPPYAKALDAGCGRQPFRKPLEALGYSYTSFDVQQSPENTVDVIAALDEPLPSQLISRGPFHFILCTEVLEHVADWDRAFGNLATLLAPGGRLLITCPHFYQLHEEPYDFWRPTPHALKYFGWRVGLRVLQDKAAGDAWDVLGTLLANCSPFSPSYRISDRLVRKLVALSQEYLLKLLRSGRLQRIVQLQGPLYLSNVAVLERPCESP
jgi:SAM-dependent methyltransferase